MDLSLHKELIEEISRIGISAKNNNCVRAVSLPTTDRPFAISLLMESSKSTESGLFQFSLIERKQFNWEKGQWKQIGIRAGNPSSLIQEAQRIKESAFIVLEEISPYFSEENGNPELRLELFSILNSEKKSPGIVMVFLDGNPCKYPSMLADKIIEFKVPHPKIAELGTIVREEITTTLQKRNEKLDIAKIKKNSDFLVDSLTGLTREQAKRKIQDGCAYGFSNIKEVKTYIEKGKKEILQKELSMNIPDSNAFETPVGHEYVYEYFQTIKDNVRDFGPNRPKGIASIGFPGVGKSNYAKFVGHLLGLPVVEFRPTSLMDSLLGETEKRFDRAFSVFEAMAPNIVFIDEIDKVFSQGGGESDGGTWMRVTARLLNWMAENPNPNLIIATGNNPIKMREIGQTMFRSGRIDRVYWFDVPSHAARYEMSCNWLKGNIKNYKSIAEDLADETEKFTGADIKTVINQAKLKAKYQKKSTLFRNFIRRSRKKTDEGFCLV